jgi:hypothetical protein
MTWIFIAVKTSEIKQIETCRLDLIQVSSDSIQSVILHEAPIGINYFSDKLLLLQKKVHSTNIDIINTNKFYMNIHR